LKKDGGSFLMVSMEAFIESYRLPFAPFQELVQSTNSLVAGSAALALYLQQHGVDPGFTPGDMDIWAEDTHELVAARGAYQQHGNLYLFSNFLIQNGFNVTMKCDPKETDYETFHNIRHILSFINREGKTIQLILVQQKNILHYIQDNFDLSPCISWWNSGNNTFETLWEKETLRKDMMYCLTQEISGREIERIEKYKERGFRLIPFPCPAIDGRDARTDVSCLAGQTAFDLFAYEDVDCAAFLQDSSWNMLIRVGEQFHAFHRTTFVDYMKEHMIEFQGENLYDTPFKQTIPCSALVWIACSDYSIVELIPQYTVQNGHTMLSIHECFFYTVKQWTERRPGHVESSLPPDRIRIPPCIPLYHDDVYWMDG
jgi:hypothetical protein